MGAKDFKKSSKLIGSDKFMAFLIGYMGDGTAATVAKTGNTLTIVATGGVDGSAGTYNFDLSNALYDTLNEIVAAINATHRAFRAVLGPDMNGDEASVDIPDISSTSIRVNNYSGGGPENVGYTVQINHEVVEINRRLVGKGDGYAWRSIIVPLSVIGVDGTNATKQAVSGVAWSMDDGGGLNVSAGESIRFGSSSAGQMTAWIPIPADCVFGSKFKVKLIHDGSTSATLRKIRIDKAKYSIKRFPSSRLSCSAGAAITGMDAVSYNVDLEGIAPIVGSVASGVLRPHDMLGLYIERNPAHADDDYGVWNVITVVIDYQAKC